MMISPYQTTIEELQQDIAKACERFDNKGKTKETDEEKRIRKVEAISLVISSHRRFHKAIGTNPEHAALLNTIYGELADISCGVPSMWLQVRNIGRKPKLNRLRLQGLMPTYAAVTLLIKSGQGLEAACRYVIARLKKRGVRLPFAYQSTKKTEDWRQLKGYRNNFVSGQRDVSDDPKEKFYPAYQRLLEQAGEADPGNAANIILDGIDRFLP